MAIPFQTIRISALCLCAVVAAAPAQEPAGKPAEQADKDAKTKKPELPFQIQLLETHVRFEANGDSRKEVHTVVRINDLLGARQFSRIAFDYNRAFQQVEIPLLRITHANGGTSEVLPSAVMDAPNPAAEKYPAYQDVRVKSVRVLGLKEGDTLEYRVTTTTTHPPMAPDFWLQHTFDRSGEVLEELYTLDLPRSLKPRVNLEIPPASTQARDDQTGMTTYRWERKQAAGDAQQADTPEAPDVFVATFPDWMEASTRFANLLYPDVPAGPVVQEKARALLARAGTPKAKLQALYDFLSQTIVTVELPLGATGYRTRPAAEILASGYATQEDKASLFSALARRAQLEPVVYLTFRGSGRSLELLPRLEHILLGVTDPNSIWMDPSSGVAPFGMISSAYRGRPAFRATALHPGREPSGYLPQVPEQLPFPAIQNVHVNAELSAAGQLSAKVKYTMRGDNELLLRVAFHRTPKEKWKDLAALLALSDGFRGQITSVDASEPAATKDPFTVEYELAQPNFVDWSKKPVRIPALLPQIALPDPPAATAAGKAAPKIELGTPLDVRTTMVLRLPAGTSVQTPVGTSVARDYATFASKYSATQNTVTASRRVNFLVREIAGDRAMDYNAFLHAVQSDQTQRFTLVEPGEVIAKPAPASRP
ncbi:MAG TPA: DUF3857 and transglutaminase domain-containing protein [Candidatus Acidoferrum sp.]